MAGTLSPWFRFGLPLGQALLIVGLLEGAFLLINTVKSFAEALYFLLIHSDGEDAFHSSISEHAFLIGVALLTFSTVVLLWIGGIFMGNKLMLAGWMVVKMIFSIPWLASLFYFDGEIFVILLYLAGVLFVIFGYQIVIAICSYRTLRNDKNALQPIGKGILHIWEFFNNDSKAGARFCLVSEITLDAFFLLSRQFLVHVFNFPLYGHESEEYTPIFVEQLVLKCLRVVYNGIGLFLVTYDKKREFRLWTFGGCILLLMSLVIFVILTVMWRGEELIITVTYFLLFPGHLIYRSVVLYFCMRYSQINIYMTHL